MEEPRLLKKFKDEEAMNDFFAKTTRNLIKVVNLARKETIDVRHERYRLFLNQPPYQWTAKMVEILDHKVTSEPTKDAETIVAEFMDQHYARELREAATLNGSLRKYAVTVDEFFQLTNDCFTPQNMIPSVEAWKRHFHYVREYSDNDLKPFLEQHSIIKTDFAHERLALLSVAMRFDEKHLLNAARNMTLADLRVAIMMHGKVLRDCFLDEFFEEYFRDDDHSSDSD